MMNSGANNMMSSASAASGSNAQGPGLKTYFKTPEGKYKLQYEKTHPAGLLHYAHGKTVTQVCYFLPPHFLGLLSLFQIPLFWFCFVHNFLHMGLIGSVHLLRW